MLHVILPIVLCLPLAAQVEVQGDVVQDRVTKGKVTSRSLPPKQTLLAFELPSRKVLLENRESLPILRMLLHPKAQGLLAFAASQDKEFGAVYEDRAAWLDWIDRFDDGLLCAGVFTKRLRGTPRPESFFVGAAKTPDRLRDFDAAFEKLMLRVRSVTNPEAPPFKKSRRPIAMPLTATIIESRRKYGNSDQEMRVPAYLMRKGRVGVLHTQRFWIRKEQEVETIDSNVGEALAALVSKGRRNEAMRFEDQASYAKDETVLARAVVRIADNIRSKVHGVDGERDLEAVKESGVWDWEGLTGALLKSERGVREVVDSFSKNVKGDTLFGALRADARSLGDSAESLPANALAAIRLAFDPEMATRWLLRFEEKVIRGDDVRQSLGILRETLALQGAADAGLAGIPELLVTVLPQAAAVLAPEYCLMIRCEDGGDAQVQNVARRLSTAVTAVLSWGRGNPKAGKIRKLGKGDDAVTYIAFKDYYSSPRGGGVGEEAIALKALFGGGYLSVMRVGPYLAIGLNPRTMRKFKRDVRAGKTLDTKAGFLEHFPKKSGRFMEAWIDWKGIAEGMRVVDQALPLIFGMVAVDGRRMRAHAREVAKEAVRAGGEKPKKPDPAKAQAPKLRPRLVLPTSKDIASIVGEQRIFGTQTEYGHRFEFEGSLVVAPIVVGILGISYEMYEQTMRLVRR